MAVTVRVSIREARVSHATTDGLALGEVTGVGPTYADAKAAAFAKIPENWQAIGLISDVW